MCVFRYNSGSSQLKDSSYTPVELPLPFVILLNNGEWNTSVAWEEQSPKEEIGTELFTQNFTQLDREWENRCLPYRPHSICAPEAPKISDNKQEND